MAAWLAPLQPQLRLYLAGPAKKLFLNRLGASAHFVSTLEEALDGAQVLISGTGWESDLEFVARRLARQRGIPSVAVLDHWLNYRERFQREGDEQLPDEFWVADAEAATLATESFPNVPVLQLPNHWLQGLRSTVLTLRSKTNSQPVLPSRRLLYLLEPIRVPWSQGLGGQSESGEIQGLRYWLQKLPHLIELGWVAPQVELDALCLRLHPSEPLDKYDAFIAESAASWPIQLDRSPGLAEALAWADAAFGCETQALVAAMSCNLPAFSTVPDWAPPCRLPQATLHHLSRLEGI